MILGFKEQFEMPIKKGTKVHTIREDKHNRWKPGMLIHFAKGARTKKCINFMLEFCKSVQCINIRYYHNDFGDNVTVQIDGRNLQESEVLELAKNDGFNSIEDFFKWFNKDFSGKVIHWTDLRY